MCVHGQFSAALTLDGTLGPLCCQRYSSQTLSCVLAVALFFAVYRFKSKGLHPGATVWYDALGRTPAGKRAWVGIHRADGSLVEGFLFSYSIQTKRDQG